MGKFHHSKKAHSSAERTRGSSKPKYDILNSGRKKLPEDFVYTQHHKSIWNSFCNFFDERLAEEDLAEILDEDEITRIKTAPTIPPRLEFEPANLGDIETEEAKRARLRRQAIEDKSYAGKEAHHLDGIKKLASKFNRATVLVLKHVDALINLDMHQFLKSDPIKRLGPETKYRRLRQYFSERWGPHTSLDVSKIKSDLTSMQGDNPGWRKYLQNFNCSVGSLEQTAVRDAADQIMYGPTPPAIYPPRPAGTAPAAEHTAYVNSYQLADEIRDAQYPNGGPALNHRPTDAELKTILLDALAVSLRTYQTTLYQQYCNRSHNGKTYLDLYNDIHDLVKYEPDGVKSSTRDSEIEDSDASGSTRGSSRSSNSHSSRRAAQIAAAVANQNSMQVAANTTANSDILYQQSPGRQGTSPNNPGRAPQAPCKNCKSTKHGTKWCTSTKCFEAGCGKTFATAEERKSHFINEHGTLVGKTTPQKSLKSVLKDGSRKPKVKFSKANRMVSLANRVQRDLDQANQSELDSDVSSDSSMSVDHEPKSLVWKGTPSRINSGRKVSHLRTVSSIRRTEEYCYMPPVDQDSKLSGDQSDNDEDAPPPLCEDSDSSDDERDDVPPPLCVNSSDDKDGDEPPPMRADSPNDESDDEPPPLCVDDESSNEEDLMTWVKNNRRTTPAELEEWINSIETKTGKKIERRAPSKGPNPPPTQAAKLGSGNNDYEGESARDQAMPSVPWDCWQHNTAQPKSATSPVEDPEPIAPPKGPDITAPTSQGART